MPSRTEFLNGLVPIMPTDEDCTICHATLTVPVTLPCSHTYDLECLKRWVSLRGNNTCPLCRRVLFDLDADEIDGNDDEDDDVEHIQALDIRIGQPGTAAHDNALRRALRLSGLQESRSRQRTAIEVFDLGVFSEEEIYRASVAVAQHFRRGWGANNQGELVVNTGDGEHEVVRGDLMVDNTPTLLARVVALAHLVPAMAMATDFPYNSEERRDWETAVFFLGFVLKEMSRTTIDVSALPIALVDGVAKELAAHGQHHAQNVFLRAHEEFGSLNLCKLDFDAVIDYICHFLWKDQQARG